LVGFQRDHIAAGTSREVSLSIDLRSLSSVNDKGIRSILPGKCTLSLGSAQPQEITAKSEAGFSVNGLLELPE
jgi:beta-glucosidase